MEEFHPMYFPLSEEMQMSEDYEDVALPSLKIQLPLIFNLSLTNHK